VERIRRVGVLGTLVWDRIWLHGASAPHESWGGIAYSLAAWAAACPPGWEVVPLLKLGNDLEGEARSFLRELPHLAMDGVREVPEASNRVELRYTDSAHRGERLEGGVPPWTWEELAPVVHSLDALYVNFITGDEMRLSTAEQLRRDYPGPIYADLHSLLLGHGTDGHRFPRALLEWGRWVACFNTVQTNESELRTQAEHAGIEPWSFAAHSLQRGPEIFVVTTGTAGAEYVVSGGQTAPGTPHAGHVRLSDGELEGDPTGCGDVWGSVLFARLLAGDAIEPAIRTAHRAAGRKMGHSGASGLYMHLAQGSFSA
jgi:sugar/nucleoside kinase (ribokinase family)